MERARRAPGGSGAFVLAELIAILAITCIMAAALLLAASQSRRQAALSDDLANLKQFAGATQAFGADNDDLFWTFSWLPNTVYTVVENGQTVMIQSGPDSLTAAASQAAHIIRARGGVNFPRPAAWLPHLLYSHLVLVDYLDTDLPARFAISSADRNRIDWQRAIRDGDANGSEYFQLPNRPLDSPPTGLRWPFSSSFEVGPAFFSRDASMGNQQTISQGQSHRLYIVGTLPLGGRRLTEVRFPSLKSMLHDPIQRHFGPRRSYFAYDEASTTVLFADGSAAVRSTGDANSGFNPNNPNALIPTQFAYDPEASWEPPRLPGQGSIVTGHYRWTRSGLRGRDFGGPEVPWVP